MTETPTLVRRAVELVKADGVRGTVDHLVDRWREVRRRGAFRALEPVRWTAGAPEPEPWGLPATGTVSYLTTRPAPWYGGVQRSVLARRRIFGRGDGATLVYPIAAGYRVEVLRGSAAVTVDFLVESGASGEFRDPGLEGALRWVARSVEADLLHVESLHDAPFKSLTGLGEGGLRQVVSLHDFAAFCRRPHLLERPELSFCDYCRDLARCHRCLERDWPVDTGFQARYRSAAGLLLRGADALVFPSDFLRRRIDGLFEGLDASRQWVVRPAADRLVPRPPAAVDRRCRIAFVGQTKPHKGTRVLRELLEGWDDPAGVETRWLVLGGGDPANLADLRQSRPSLSVRGSYRAGTLPGVLRRERVDLALLLSVVPESYSLVLDECRAVGVPVVAFDLGALGERIRSEGGGFAVPVEEGVEGLRERVRSLVTGAAVPPLEASVTGPEDAARRYREVYAAVRGAAVTRMTAPRPPSGSDR